jgi:hypothetical protein
MNAKTLQQILIEAGYTFRKSHDHITEKSVWTMKDDDSIPVISGHYLGELIMKASRELGCV